MHAKRYAFFLFALVQMTVGALCLYAQTGGHLSAVWANDGGDKVTRDELRASADAAGVRNSVWDGNAVRIFGARNEVVAFNLVLEAATAAANQVSVNFDALHGPQGFTIGSSPASGEGIFNWVGRNIEMFYVRYLQIRGLSTDLFFAGYDYDERHVPQRFRRPWTGEGEGSGGWTDRPDHDKFYPEIAVPLELVQTFDIPAGQNQSIWVDVYIPKDAPKGEYTGTVAIKEGGSVVRQVPVVLTVRDFTLPDVPTAKTMLFMGYEDVNQRYLGMEYPDAGSAEDAQARLIRDRHFQLAHRHRISLIDGNERSIAWNADWEPMDQPSEEWLPRLDGTLFTAAHGYDGPGVGVGNGVYSIGTYGSWWWQGEGEAAMRQHADAWVNWFEAHAPNTEYFLYLIDESDDFAQIQQWAQWINNDPGPGRRLLSMATIAFPTAAANTPGLDIPTSWFNVGLASEWQPAVEAFRKNPDKRVYFYNSNRPASGSFATEDEGVALRELAWGQYKMGIDRWFYWESVYYHNFQADSGQTNVFQTAHTFGSFDRVDAVFGETGGNYLNGDGVLFYPGTDRLFPAESYGVKGPFASLRLKHWRRGIQDVDYLTLAARVDSARVARIVERMVPKVLWEVGVTDPADPTWVLSDISWPTDPDRWEAARAELAEIIESGPSAAPEHTVNPPRSFILLQNYPNPFNPATTFWFELPQPGYATLKILDLRGREVATVIAEKLAAGRHEVRWFAKGLSSGVYVYRLRLRPTGRGRPISATKKLLLLR